MSARKVEEKGGAVKGEAEIWYFTILRACLRNRLQTSPAKEGHQEMQKNGVTCRIRCLQIRK